MLIGVPSETDPEPSLLADRLRAAVPAPGSAVVLIADASAVNQMVTELAAGEAHVTRGTLNPDEVRRLNAALREAVPSGSSA